jgi:hypothetical protein
MNKYVILTGVGLITILCVSYLHFRTSVAAQVGQETDVSQIQGRIVSFFDAFINNQHPSPDTYQNAYQRMFSGAQPSNISDMVQKTEEMISERTNWRYERLDTKLVGSDLILMRYLCKSETHPVIWYFTFYRSPNTRNWNCLGIRFDTDYDSLFKESWPK